MSRYKYTKLRNLGPVHGFLIQTPDDRQLKDVYPQFIVRELNRLNDKIKRLENAGTDLERLCSDLGASLNWLKAKEDKP